MAAPKQIAAEGSVWNAITDFTPGIHQRLSSSYAPGTASLTNTYRCYARDGGALAPLRMRQRQDITYVPPIAPSANQASEFRIVGLATVDPVFWGPEATPGIDQDNTEVFICIEVNTNNTIYFIVARYRRHYQYNPAWEVVWTSTALPNTFNAHVPPRHCEFGIQRSNYPAAADFTPEGGDPITHGGASPISGPTVLAWVVNGYARFFPDDSNPTANTTVALPGDKTLTGEGALVSPDSLVMHQGRAVIMPITIVPFGDMSVYAHNEAIYTTQFNNLRAIASYHTEYPYDGSTPASTTEAPSYFGVGFGGEHPTGYQVMASLTSNELLLIKSKGGGLIIQGDVEGIGPDSASVRTLPYLRSPGLSQNKGAYGPVGYVYPCDGGGVWLWQGGDFSTDISKAMLPEFWRPPAEDISGNPTDFGYQNTSTASINEYVLLPNNFLWDSTTQAWWRTDNPDEFISFRWDGDWRNRFMYATPSGFVDNTDVAVREYNMVQGAQSYSWQSQPLVTTIDASVQVLNVALATTGHGTVDVTVSSLQDPLGQTQRFYADSDEFPTVTRQSFGVRGTHITFRVVSEGTDDNEAPSVMELRYETGIPTPIGRD